MRCTHWVSGPSCLNFFIFLVPIPSSLRKITLLHIVSGPMSPARPLLQVVWWIFSLKFICKTSIERDFHSLSPSILILVCSMDFSVHITSSSRVNLDFLGRLNELCVVMDLCPLDVSVRFIRVNPLTTFHARLALWWLHENKFKNSLSVYITVNSSVVGSVEPLGKLLWLMCLPRLPQSLSVGWGRMSQILGTPGLELIHHQTNELSLFFFSFSFCFHVLYSL